MNRTFADQRPTRNTRSSLVPNPVVKFKLGTRSFGLVQHKSVACRCRPKIFQPNLQHNLLGASLPPYTLGASIGLVDHLKSRNELRSEKRSQGCVVTRNEIIRNPDEKLTRLTI